MKKFCIILFGLALISGCETRLLLKANHPKVILFADQQRMNYREIIRYDCESCHKNIRIEENYSQNYRIILDEADTNRRPKLDK